MKTSTLLHLFACCILFASCEPRLQVGDLREVAPDAGIRAQDAASDGMLSVTRRAPAFECSAYALAEVADDQTYVGCSDGQLYVHDGIKAQLSLEIDRPNTFSLLWADTSGAVWAGAHNTSVTNGKTQWYRRAQGTWAPVGEAAERYTAIAGKSEAGLWATTGKEIRKWNGTSFERVFTASRGEFRACAFAFASAEEGYCTGTEGLAAAWNGSTWTELSTAPWSAKADVVGVDARASAGPIFFFVEPPVSPSTRPTLHAAQWASGTFKNFSASADVLGSRSLPRDRVASVDVNLQHFSLLTLDDQYGGGVVFDPQGDAFRSLCGPILAFAAGPARTRIAGFYGLFGLIVGTGGAPSVQLGTRVNERAWDFSALSVASNGTAWTRASDASECGSSSETTLRFEQPAWREVSGPLAATQGKGLAALSAASAFTVSETLDELQEYSGSGWFKRETLPGNDGWSLFAENANAVWIGGYTGALWHFDGRTIATVVPGGGTREIRQITSARTGDLWMVTGRATSPYIFRYNNGNVSEWDRGFQSDPVSIATVETGEAWTSGSPAMAWNGSAWTPLPFPRSRAVWARSAHEVYFAVWGDIYRWDGTTSTQVYRGSIPIRTMDGRGDHGFAVGPGGLTLEFGLFPSESK